MKKTTIAICLMVATLFANAQTAEWTKDDRNNVYEDCLNTITKYKNLTQEQKESVSLCYLEEVTKKYSKKEYQAKIEIELKRIKESTILQCAKNIGVDLSPKKEEEKPAAKEQVKKNVNEGNFTRDDLVGVWRDDNSKMFFNADGSFIAKLDDGTSFGSTWWLNEAKNIIISNFGTLSVLSFDGNNLKYQQTVLVKKNLFQKKSKTSIFTAVRQQ